jgi:hypothetical protein
MGLIYSTPTAPRSLNYRHSGVPDWTGKEEHTEHTSPPQTQLATSDVEAGAELGEGRGREALGEDVGKLGGGWDTERALRLISHFGLSGVQVQSQCPQHRCFDCGGMLDSGMWLASVWATVSSCSFPVFGSLSNKGVD